MINTGLPTTVEIDGKEYKITNNADWRLVLDVLEELNDKTENEQTRAAAALILFYEEMPDDPQKALDEMVAFIRMYEDEDDNEDAPLMDWKQDFPLIISPVNKALGYETRDPNKYTHWWTWLGGFHEVGTENTWARVINIRLKRRKGQPLDKTEEHFYRENRKLVDLKIRLTKEEEDWLAGD